MPKFTRKHRTVALLLPLALPVPDSLAAPAPIIINEYNCVADNKFLEADDEAFEGYDYGAFWTATASAGAGKQGRIMGNGGNWIELVVTQDHLDLRGFSLEWSNADPDAGSFSFTSHPLWADVRAGTIITVIEDGIFAPTFADNSTGPLVNLGTDTSFNPALNDWWINLDLDDAVYLSQHGFKVDNDNWQGAIKDASGNVVFGPVGEGLPGWGGSGINSQEMGMLNENPSPSVTPLFFNDRDYSTFGAPNLLDPANSAATLDQLIPQDFSYLRDWWVLGDADGDHDVDLDDLHILLAHLGQSGIISGNQSLGDFNWDGRVNTDDLALFDRALTQYGATATVSSVVPEPATLGLLTLAPAILVRRRRQAA